MRRKKSTVSHLPPQSPCCICEGNGPVSAVSGQQPYNFAPTFSLHLPLISLTSQNSVLDSTFPGG